MLLTEQEKLAKGVMALILPFAEVIVDKDINGTLIDLDGSKFQFDANGELEKVEVSL